MMSSTRSNDTNEERGHGRDRRKRRRAVGAVDDSEHADAALTARRVRNAYQAPDQHASEQEHSSAEESPSDGGGALYHDTDSEQEDESGETGRAPSTGDLALESGLWTASAIYKAAQYPDGDGPDTARSDPARGTGGTAGREVGEEAAEDDGDSHGARASGKNERTEETADDETEGAEAIFEDAETRGGGLRGREKQWAKNVLHRRARGSRVLDPTPDGWTIRPIAGEWTSEVKAAWAFLAEYIPEEQKPAREWSIRRLLDGWSDKSYIKKRLARVSVTKRCGTLDVLWAAVAVGQDLGEVDPGVERHEFSARTVRYCHGWRVQLQAGGELFAATEDRGHFYGISYERTVAIYATLVARGADWHPGAGRQIRRSYAAMNQTVHDWSGGDKKLSSAAVRSFLLARMAAGDVHVERGVPDEAMLTTCLLTEEQRYTLRRLRSGEVIGSAGEAGRYELSTLLCSHEDVDAPRAREQRRHTLILLGVAASQELPLSAPRGPGSSGFFTQLGSEAEYIALVAEHVGVKCYQLSVFGQGRDVVTLDEMDDTTNPTAIAHRLIASALPHGAIEVVLGDPSARGRIEYAEEERHAGVQYARIAAAMLEHHEAQRVRVISFHPAGYASLSRPQHVRRKWAAFTGDESLYVWLRAESDESRRARSEEFPEECTIESANIEGGITVFTALSKEAMKPSEPGAAHGLRYEARAARRRAWRMRRQSGRPRSHLCPRCKANHRLYVDDEHPRGSARRQAGSRSPFAHLWRTEFCHCIDGEAVLMKPTVTLTNVFSRHRPCRLRMCGQKGRNGVEVCDHLPVPPSGNATRGRHKFIIARDRTMTACGRGVKAIDHKHHVPQLYYADLAKAIEEQEGPLFARHGGIWVSVCAGGHSDELAALRYGYKYIPIDIREVVRSFGDLAPNWCADLAVVDLYDTLVEILGDELLLLDVVVVHFSVPCETHSVASSHLHRKADGSPHDGPRGDRAREVDAIDDNAGRFLRRLDELKARHGAARCSCAGND